MTGTSLNGAPRERRFPPGFLWGASTSAYQIEGAVDEDGRGRCIWDTFSHTPGKVHGGDTGDIACDSYHRLEEDLALLSGLGVGAYRFSVAWSRVLPNGRGPVNQRGLDYYRALVAGLRSRGIVPVATAYHWELPQALEDEGGWANRETAERFAEYAGVLAQALGDEVGMWITLNEPQQTANQGYRTGTHAPGKTDLALAAAATHHLLLAHGLAVQAIRGALPGQVPVGITIDLHPFRAVGEGAAHAATMLDADQNRIFLEPVLHGSYPDAARAELLPPEELIESGDMAQISVPLDFLGLNYYCPHYVRVGDWDDLRRGESPMPGYPGIVNYVPPEIPRTSMGWLIEPEGLYDALRDARPRSAAAAAVRHRERLRGGRLREPRGSGERLRAGQLSGRPLRRRLAGDRRRCQPRRLLRLVADGQLRVGARISASLRPVLRGLRNAAAHPEGERRLLLRRGERERAPVLLEQRRRIRLLVALLQRSQEGLDDRRVELTARRSVISSSQAFAPPASPGGTGGRRSSPRRRRRPRGSATRAGSGGRRSPSDSRRRRSARGGP